VAHAYPLRQSPQSLASLASPQPISSEIALLLDWRSSRRSSWTTDRQREIKGRVMAGDHGIPQLRWHRVDQMVDQ